MIAAKVNIEIPIKEKMTSIHINSIFKVFDFTLHPQFGHISAFEFISFPHSLHFFFSIFIASINNYTIILYFFISN